MFSIFLACEIISVAIYCIMLVSDGFKVVIPHYGEKKDRFDEFGMKVIPLCLMALVGGWIFAPYFIYLVYKYYTLHKQ